MSDIDTFEATFTFGDLTLDEALENLRSFAREVMPAVRAEFSSARP